MNATGSIERSCTGQTDGTGIFTSTFCPKVNIETFCGQGPDNSIEKRGVDEYIALGYADDFYGNALGFKPSGTVGEYCYARISSIINYENDNKTTAPKNSTIWAVIDPDGWLSGSAFWEHVRGFGDMTQCQDLCRNLMLMRMDEGFPINVLLNIFLANS